MDGFMHRWKGKELSVLGVTKERSLGFDAFHCVGSCKTEGSGFPGNEPKTCTSILETRRPPNVRETIFAVLRGNTSSISVLVSIESV